MSSKSRKKLRKKFPRPRIPLQQKVKLETAILQDLNRFAEVHFTQGIDTLLERYDNANVYLAPSEQSTGVDQQHKAIAACRLVCEVTRKYTTSGDETRLDEAAMAAFHAAEATCHSFNRSDWKRVRDSSLTRDARVFIERVIGRCPPEGGRLTLEARFGPGASVGNTAELAHKYFKYASWPYTVTADALNLSRDLIQSDIRWFGALEDSYRRRFDLGMNTILDWDLFWSRIFKVVPGNRVCTVPKDSSKNRTIAIEPTMNGMLQLGVDGFIRRRLKRFGIDLNDQSKNCLLAHEGSVRGNVATLDLSAASDTVSLRVAKLLLPPCWFKHLCLLRSSKGELPDGKVLRYAKISSMGNGFTFALESLVFASLVYASLRASNIPWVNDEVAIYGDDIIVNSDAVYRTIATLELFGFKLNLDKSFSEGPFRESCGTDWYLGHPVRSVYHKAPLDSVLDIYKLHNALLKWSVITMEDVTVLHGTLKWLQSLVPERLRLFGPMDDDDLSSYLMDPDWVPSFDEVGNALPYMRCYSTPRKWQVTEWFFGRLLCAHKGGQVEPRRSFPLLRWRGALVFRPTGLDLDDPVTGAYEVTLRKEGHLKLQEGFRFTPGTFGRSVSDLARCQNRAHGRRFQ